MMRDVQAPEYSTLRSFQGPFLVSYADRDRRTFDLD
jgi:hypothetical protein